MNDDLNLSQDEIGALLGNGVDLSATSSNGSSSMGAFIDIINNASAGVKQSLSQTLGDETALSVASVEESRGLSCDGAVQWYVAQGSFSNGKKFRHYFVFSAELAQQIVSQFLKIGDTHNDIDQLGGPLAEISEGIINAIQQSLGKKFDTVIGEYESVEDLSQVAGDDSLIKIEWSFGTNSFFEFFGLDILESVGDETETSSKNDDSNFLSDLDSSNSNEESDIASSMDGGILSSLGSGEDESMSLGESLLGVQSAVSGVNMPSFDNDKMTGSDNNSSINMLKDVTMDVTVELGSTKKLIGDILELNRGSIIELKKLAGEPLDIKINNKLIAKGEVVVIDEYFGVRIIEIVSPNQKPII